MAPAPAATETEQGLREPRPPLLLAILLQAHQSACESLGVAHWGAPRELQQRRTVPDRQWEAQDAAVRRRLRCRCRCVGRPQVDRRWVDRHWEGLWMGV